MNTLLRLSRARRTTFRARLTAATTLLCLSVLVLAGSIVYWKARQALRAGLDASLLGIARAEVASALDGPGGSVHVHEEPTALMLAAGTGYEKFAQVEDSADKVIARTENLGRLTPLPPNPGLEGKARAGHIMLSEMHLHGVPLRAVYYPFQDAHGTRLLAIIAISQEPMRRALHALLQSLGLSLLLAGIVIAVGADRLARRLTIPLEKIAAATRSVGGSTLGGRIPAFSPDAELREVTDVLNEMLTRLEAAFLAQARFVADASHELRSPLSNLRGTVEVALRRPRTPEEYRQTLQVSLTEIERLSRLASDLLTLSRADTHGFLVTPGECDLAQSASQAVFAHAPRADERQVRLHLDSRGPLPVRGDLDRLRQVLDNLLDNALRHAPGGSVVTVAAYREGDDCAVQVRDTGAGLSLEDQERIFDRFYRVDAARARQTTGQGGLGLGLAIAKAIVEAHGGRINVQSEPGAGAAFTFLLPAAGSAQDSHQ